MADIDNNNNSSTVSAAFENLAGSINSLIDINQGGFGDLIGATNDMSKSQDKLLTHIKKQEDKAYEEAREGIKDVPMGGQGAAKGAAAVAKGPAQGPAPKGAAGPLADLLRSFGAAGAGIAAAGVGIGGFFLALAGAEAIMSKFGSGDNLKNLLVNIGTGLKAFDTQGLLALGAAMAGGAVLGAAGGIRGAARGAAGMIGVGVGLGGFFVGLSASDVAINAMGDGASLKTLMTNLAGGINAFNADNLTALGGVMAGGAILGAAGGIKMAAKGAAGMVGVGLGIGGFFAGLSAGDLAIDKMGDGASLKTLMENLAAGINAFEKEQLVALGGVMGVGAVLGAGGGITMAAKGAGGMMAIGLGLGGFFAGISAADAVIDKLGTGAALSTLMTNIAGGLKEFDGAHLTALAAAMGVGAVMGPLGGLIAAGGMTLIGAGIGGFFVGLGGAGKIGDLLGIDGTALKTIMTNTAQGLKEFDAVDGKNFEALGSGMLQLGPGIAALLVTDGFSRLTEGIVNTLKGAWNWITGKEETEEKKSRFAIIADELKYLEDIKIPNVDGKKFGEVLTGISDGLDAFSGAKFVGALSDAGAAILSFIGLGGDNKTPIEEMLLIADKEKELTKGATAIERLAQALGNIAALDFKGDELDMKGFAEDLSQSMPAIEASIMGGKISGGWFSSDHEYKGLASADIKWEEAAKNITKLTAALNTIGGGVQPMPNNQFEQTNKGALENSGQGTVNIINSDNSSTDNSVMSTGGGDGGLSGVTLGPIPAGSANEADNPYVGP